MNNNFGLSARELKLISDVLQQHVEVAAALIFGSRAKGTFRHNSDIDLVLSGDIPSLTISQIFGELDDLPLPYKFDVAAYNSIGHAPLREHIDRVGKLIYSRQH